MSLLPDVKKSSLNPCINERTITRRVLYLQDIRYAAIILPIELKYKMFIDLPSSDFPHACQLRQGKFIFKMVGEKVLVVVGQGGKIISCRLSLFFPLDHMGVFDFFRNNNFLNRGIQLILTSFLFKITRLGFAAAVPHQTTDEFNYGKQDRKS